MRIQALEAGARDDTLEDTATQKEHKVNTPVTPAPTSTSTTVTECSNFRPYLTKELLLAMGLKQKQVELGMAIIAMVQDQASTSCYANALIKFMEMQTLWTFTKSTEGVVDSLEGLRMEYVLEHTAIALICSSLNLRLATLQYEAPLHGEKPMSQDHYSRSSYMASHGQH
ncbi:hypothetical protein Tco_0532264 [Tanacetum coccineum]